MDVLVAPRLKCNQGLVQSFIADVIADLGKVFINGLRQVLQVAVRRFGRSSLGRLVEDCDYLGECI